MKKYEIIVIGAGAGGLVVAIGAAKAGKKVLLIEKEQYGGDCTNFGCIPSKSLIASAEAAHAITRGTDLGISFEMPKINGDKALDRLRSIIEGVRSHEDAEALEGLGVETLTGEAKFIDPHHLQVGSETVFADKIVVATGSYPFIPPIEGLKGAPYLTNETIFDLEKIPPQLAILGAGPIGCELAQAFARLGSQVTIIESERGILPNEEPEVQEVMKAQLEKEQIQLFIRCEANLIGYQDKKFLICISENGRNTDIEADQLLVSTGRRPTVTGLDLEKANVVFSGKGIEIDAYGRTNQSHIFAIGDVTGDPFFTHKAENHGRAVLTTLLLPGFLKKKIDKAQPIPRCTFTDPEVAQVGVSEKEAIDQFGEKKIAIYKAPFSEVDRAITQGREEGYVKVVTKKWSSQILGATIVAPRAGEMLPEIALAMQNKIPLRKLASLIHPYPIYNAAIRKCADLWLSQTILPQLKKWFKR